MALKYCHECKGVVSSEAKACPHCGAKVKKNPGGALAILSFIAIILLLFIFRSSPHQPAPVAFQDKHAAPEKEEPNAWKYNSDTDPMSGKDSRSQYVASNNQHDLDFPYQGGTHGILQVRKHPRYGTDLIFSINKGQLICSYDNCTVNMKIDDQPAFKVHATYPDDHSRTSFFLSNSKQLAAKIKKSQKVVIEATLYDAGNRPFEFNSANLDLEWINGK